MLSWKLKQFQAGRIVTKISVYFHRYRIEDWIKNVPEYCLKIGHCVFANEVRFC
jgi:hypothetical protein